ncbi:MAG TPA: DUF1175 family protein [Pyrinomonadaceae bacterium]|nr:DUF1175 family protein [Pyrinomonadaceae bacterium]
MRTPQSATLGLTLLAALACLSCGRAATSGVRAASSAAPPTAAAPAGPKAAEPDAARWEDADRDGIPDRAELRAFSDRESFRRWFTGLAEMQFYAPSGEWNEGQRDCAGLVRFAWREALRPHDRAWFKRMGAGYEPLAAEVRAYTLGGGPLGEKLFRTAPGAFSEGDLAAGLFSEFADARTLKEFNAEFVGRDRRRAEPGDLLFFHQPWVQRYPFHVMIFLGPARVEPEGADDWVVYHTGASPADAGEVRKVRLSLLDRHPDPRWRPLASNRNFLGFYRLKILK